LLSSFLLSSMVPSKLSSSGSQGQAMRRAWKALAESSSCPATSMWPTLYVRGDDLLQFMKDTIEADREDGTLNTTYEHGKFWPRFVEHCSRLDLHQVKHQQQQTQSCEQGCWKRSQANVASFCE